MTLARFPFERSRSNDKKSRKIKKLEQVPIAKVYQLLRNLLWSRSHRNIVDKPRRSDARGDAAAASAHRAGGRCAPMSRLSRFEIIDRKSGGRHASRAISRSQGRSLRPRECGARPRFELAIEHRRRSRAPAATNRHCAMTWRDHPAPAKSARREFASGCRDRAPGGGSPAIADSPSRRTQRHRPAPDSAAWRQRSRRPEKCVGRKRSSRSAFAGPVDMRPSWRSLPHTSPRRKARNINPFRPRPAFRDPTPSVRGYLEKSSDGPNCVGLTKTVAINALGAFSWRGRRAKHVPRARRPWSGQARRFRRARATRARRRAAPRRCGRRRLSFPISYS